ncbi:MAG: TIR domain-containing protein [Planctomycetes bacterium]|nr:TIR domain-containing protein [Planctomycetota bacterium]
MAPRLFFSFHYVPDNWRASQVRNIGVIEGNAPVSDNDWEAVTRGGDAAIQRWIDDQMKGKSCAVVLIGAATAGRKWINYEIKKAWELGKGVVGVYIHKLLDRNGQSSVKGNNPFLDNGLGYVVQANDPAGYDSRQVYDTISTQIARWVDEAIAIRSRYPGAAMQA